MKTNSNSKVHAGLLACALAATAMVSTSTATAQGRQMEVNVPFAFHNGSQRLPAGVYRVEIQSEHLILLRGSHGSGYAMGNPQMSRLTASHGKVVFRRYGDQYFLREVWTNGSNTGIACLKSKQEKEAQIAAAKTAPSGQEVALVQQGR